jgi:hypothetical protein
MGDHSIKTFIIPTVKVDNISIAGVLQVGDSTAVFPHLDAYTQGGGRGSESFNTQFFPRSRTRLHYANQTDVETQGDLSIVEPAPDPMQFQNIRHMYQVCDEIGGRFTSDGHRFVTSTKNPVRMSYLNIKSILTSGVVHIGSTHYVAPIVHSISRGLMRGAVTGAGGPVGAIG